MNTATDGVRRWRQKKRRGVSPIIATILLVAITVVLAAVLYILISGLTKGPGNTPIGTALAMSGITDNGPVGTNYYYNLTVQSASGGLQMQSMGFQVQTSTGGIVVPAAGKVTVLSITNCGLAVYTFATNSWANPASGACAGVTLGAGASVANGQSFSMSTTTNVGGQGDSLIIIGAGSFSGQVTNPIP